VSEPEITIAKDLTANDTSETGGHQAGILIPKRSEILGFFPPLNAEYRNPRCEIRFLDPSGKEWVFNFIYYNNARVGGTRNEYRLTGMTQFLRESGLRAGDELRFWKNREGRFHVGFVSRVRTPLQSGVLKLGSSWKVVSYRR
jgi:hypothetical protein